MWTANLSSIELQSADARQNQILTEHDKTPIEENIVVVHSIIQHFFGNENGTDVHLNSIGHDKKKFISIENLSFLLAVCAIAVGIDEKVDKHEISKTRLFQKRQKPLHGNGGYSMVCTLTFHTAMLIQTFRVESTNGWSCEEKRFNTPNRTNILFLPVA